MIWHTVTLIWSRCNIMHFLQMIIVMNTVIKKSWLTKQEQHSHTFFSSACQWHWAEQEESRVIGLFCFHSQYFCYEIFLKHSVAARCYDIFAPSLQSPHVNSMSPCAPGEKQFKSYKQKARRILIMPIKSCRHATLLENWTMNSHKP